MLYLIPMNCQYILVYRKEVRIQVGQSLPFSSVSYTVDNIPRRSTQPVVYFHGERADWSSQTGKAIKKELIKVFTKLHTGDYMSFFCSPSI